MKARVLIVEDDSAIADIIALYLSKDGITTEITDTAESGIRRTAEERFDLVVLDINLPGMDGFEFLQTLRRSSTLPVIIVSARETDEDKILGLGIGADDFVTKPFSPRVLAARVRAQLRRVGYHMNEGHEDPAKPETVGFGPYTLHLEECYLDRNGRGIALSRKEFELLSYLVLGAPATFRPEELYKKVWGSEFGDLSTVAVHIRRLRLKIEDDPTAPRWILTNHGFGYRFDPTGGKK
jgi:DNA-binding response OmpR family regulator